MKKTAFVVCVAATACSKPPVPVAVSTPVVVVATATPAPAPTPAPLPVLATADGSTPGSRVEINSLTRSADGTVTLKFTLISDPSQKPLDGYDALSTTEDGYDHTSADGILLVDAKARKQYLPVRDTEHLCLCSRELPRQIPPRMSLWVKFPAPPADVTSIGVSIPHFMPVDAVAIAD
jgi:hypothetical protein